VSIFDANALAQATGATLIRAVMFLQPITDSFDEFNLDTLNRQAAYLAQIGWESMHLACTVEQGANAGVAYEGRADLGNTQPGDGVRFKGRGLIQITGRSNYAAAGKALGLDLLNHPELLEETSNAARSAAWWWSAHGCNELADSGLFTAITRKINGGTNGLSGRLALWAKAKTALGIIE